MRLTELLYEMATLQPSKTGLGLPIYVGPEEVYGAQLPHHLPRIKIRTTFGDIPLTIPQNEGEIPDFPPSLKRRADVYKRRINPAILSEIQQYIVKHRKVLTMFYKQEINKPQLKELLGL